MRNSFRPFRLGIFSASFTVEVAPDRSSPYASEVDSFALDAESRAFSNCPIQECSSRSDAFSASAWINTDGQTIFGAIEVKDIFAFTPALFLLPLKDFFYARMFDDCHTLVVIQKPLNHVGYGVDVDAPLGISPQRRPVQV